MFAYSQCTPVSPDVAFHVFFREIQKNGGYVPCISELGHDIFVQKLRIMFLLRALEERLQEKQLSSPGLELEHLLLQLDVAQEKEQHLQAEVTQLENRYPTACCPCMCDETRNIIPNILYSSLTSPADFCWLILNIKGLQKSNAIHFGV